MESGPRALAGIATTGGSTPTAGPAAATPRFCIPGRFTNEHDGISRSWFRESRAIAHLAAPLALVQLAYMAIITTDVVMMGWIGPEALAAGALASHFYWLFILFAMGLLTGATPVFSQHLAHAASA